MKKISFVICENMTRMQNFAFRGNPNVMDATCYVVLCYSSTTQGIKRTLLFQISFPIKVRFLLGSIIQQKKTFSILILAGERKFYY